MMSVDLCIQSRFDIGPFPNSVCSYKEEDSHGETDSDDVMEATNVKDEDDNTECIERVLQQKLGRKGSKCWVWGHIYVR